VEALWKYTCKWYSLIEVRTEFKNLPKYMCECYSLIEAFTESDKLIETYTDSDKLYRSIHVNTAAL